MKIIQPGNGPRIATQKESRAGSRLSVNGVSFNVATGSSVAVQKSVSLLPRLRYADF
jgi:hypothetical protein